MKILRDPPTEADHIPKRDDIITIGFPGFMSSRAQMSKYAGPEGVTVLDRHTELPLFHAKCKIAPRILHNIIPLPEVEELAYGHCSCNPVHWLTMLRTIAVRWFFDIRPLPVSYMVLSKTNLGGRSDQLQCITDVERAVAVLQSKQQAEEGVDKTKATPRSDEETEDCDENSESLSPLFHSRKKKTHLVMFGCSRGATTTLYAALRLPEHLAKHVSLVIVEAPFDTMKNVFDKSMWFPRLGMLLMKSLGRYEGEDVYALPDTTFLKCPIAFITSQVDKRVPQELTLRLMQQVKERFPQLPIHHLCLKSSTHAAMSIGNYEDRAAYVDFVRRLYDQYLL